MDIHQAQLEILRTLLFNPNTKFSRLNKLELSSDHLSYHIKQLTNMGLISKSDKGYSLTDKGKEHANRLDTENSFAKVERQPKIGVLCYILKGSSYDEEMLIQTRLKEPFYGYKGGVTGKVKYGETILDTAVREVYEETGLKGEIGHDGFVHHINHKDGQVVEDKLLAVYTVKNAKGKLLKSGEGFANEWMTLAEYRQEEKIYDGEIDIIMGAKQSSLGFIEVIHELDEF